MQAIKHRQNGWSLLTTVLLIPALLIGSALAYFAFCEARKAYWDHQVKLMCEKDGGVKVYEKVQLNLEEYKAIFPEPTIARIPYKSMAKNSDKYFLDNQTRNIRESSPKVWQLSTQLFRVDDQKLIAEKIEFSRVGGDFPTWAHESYFSCANVNLKFKKPFFDFVFSLNK